MRYARETLVSSGRSQEEIQRTVLRYGAEGFMCGFQGTHALVGFKVKNKVVQFHPPLPDPASEDYTRTPGGRRRRSPEDSHRAWEQGCRQRWRALALAIKAKLEAVECGITTFEQEFMAHIVIPGSCGKTIGELILPKIEHAYETGRAPNLALEFDGAEK